MFLFLCFLGSSAGGVGALYHSKLVAESMPLVNVSTLLDSGWFVNYANFFQLFGGGQDLGRLLGLNGEKDGLCSVEESYGIVPCCAVASCLLKKVSCNRANFYLSSNGSLKPGFCDGWCRGECVCGEKGGGGIT